VRRSVDAGKELERLSMASADTRLIHVNRARSTATGAVLFGEFADLWMRSSLLMHEIAVGSGLRYLHGVQPNQYFSKKTFTAEESGLFADATAREAYQEPVAQGYPALLERLVALKARGVSVVSAVEIFDDVKETMYSDSCCHLNQGGNDRLADFVAREMSALDAGSPRPR